MKAWRSGMIWVLPILGAAGCEVTGPDERAGPEGITLDVPGTTWERGDTIPLRLRNDAGQDLGYNLCFRVLERRVVGSWVAVQSTPEPPVCTAELRRLQPGEEAVAAQVVHPFVSDGTYRFRTSIEWPVGDGSVPVTSDPFLIAGS